MNFARGSDPVLDRLVALDTVVVVVIVVGHDVRTLRVAYYEDESAECELMVDPGARKSHRDRIYDDKTESGVTWVRVQGFPLPLRPSFLVSFPSVLLLLLFLLSSSSSSLLLFSFSHSLAVRSFMLSPRLCSV